MAMFTRCDDEHQVENIDIRHELRTVYTQIDQLKTEDNDPQHYAVVHLLVLIYERLNAVFAMQEFCNQVKR